MKTLLISISVALVIVAASVALYRYTPSHQSDTQYEEKASTTNAVMNGSLAYFKVNQDKPGKVCVKKLSGFFKMAGEQQGRLGPIINMVPCGEAVRIDDELAYQAMIVTYATR